MKCSACPRRLDTRGRNKTGLCRACTTRRPRAMRLTPTEIQQVLNTAPTTWLCRVLVARGVEVEAPA